MQRFFKAISPALCTLAISLVLMGFFPPLQPAAWFLFIASLFIVSMSSLVYAANKLSGL